MDRPDERGRGASIWIRLSRGCYRDGQLDRHTLCSVVFICTAGLPGFSCSGLEVKVKGGGGGGGSPGLCGHKRAQRSGERGNAPTTAGGEQPSGEGLLYTPLPPPGNTPEVCVCVCVCEGKNRKILENSKRKGKRWRKRENVRVKRSRQAARALRHV